MLPRWLPLCAVALVAFCSRSLALGGAGAPEIDPSLLVADVYVNPSTGDDTNLGTQTSPRRTLYGGLMLASQFNAVNQGVTVHLAPGTYLEGTAGSETAAYFTGLATAAPVVVQGQGWAPGVNTGDVILTGSEPWTGWTADGGGVWSTAWPYQMKIEPGMSFGDTEETIVPEVVRLMSGVFVNDAPYYIFRSATDPDMARLASTEGAYWIDLGADGVRGGGDDRLRVKPPASITDLNAQSVRVTTRGNLLQFWRPGAQATHQTSIVVRNLVVQHAGGTGLIFQNHGGLILEDMVFRNNKWRGTMIESPDMPATVRRSTYTGNGEQTIATRGAGMLYEDLLLQNNARQSYLVRYFGWGTGAFKIGMSRDTTFRRIRSLDNWGLGAWFDTGNLRCELVDSIIAGNSNTALFIENNNSWNIANLGSEPTVVVRNTALVNNRRPAGETYAVPGVQIGETENAVVRNCLVAGNDVQIRMNAILDRGPQRNNQFHDNVIASTADTQPLWMPQWGVAGWRTWFDTLNSATDRNTYVHPNSNAFRDRHASDIVISFSSWKSAHLNNAFNTSANKAVDANSTHTTSTHTVRPLVSIWPLHDYLSESAPSTAAFRVYRLASDISVPLAVSYTIRADAGDAQSGADFAALPGSVTIPAGALHADIAVDPVAGDATEPLEPLQITLAANASYQLGQSSATVQIDDEAGSLPSVAVAASRPAVGEGSGSSGQWTFTRTGAALGALTVNFTVAGTATATQDYVLLPGSVTFPAGESSAVLDVTPVDDSTPELSETVTLTVAAQSGVYGIVSGQDSAAVTITDDDILSVTAINQSVSSGTNTVTVPVTIYNPGATSATFTISPPNEPYTWGASSLLTAPDYEWVEIIDNANPADNGTTIPGPGAFVTSVSPSGFTDGMFTWTVGGYSGDSGYSGGWYRNPLPNTSGEASRGSATIPLGFTFPFYGQNYSQIYLHSHGFLAVVDDPAGYEWNAFYNRVKPKRWFQNSRGLPSSDEATYPTPRGAIAGFWEDLTYLYNESKIAYKALPDRFVVTYQNMGARIDVAPFVNRFTFQVIVYADGTLDYQYKRVDRPLGADAGTVGLTNPDASKAVLVSSRDGFITANQRVRMKYQPTWASVSSQSVVVPAGGSATINVTLDPAYLADGIHSLSIPISSSNALQPTIVMPVSLGVGDLAGSLQFTGTSATVDETSGSVSLSVSRLSGFSGAVSVGYRIVPGGTAAAGADFTAASGTLSWPDGDFASGTINVPVLDDFDVEGDETFTVELYDPAGGAMLGSPASVLVTIRDNDQAVSGGIAVSATPVTPQQIDLAWTSVSNATAFRVERSADGGTTWQPLAAAVPAGTYSLTDTGLAPGTAYHYRVQAFNPVSTGDWGAASATTAAAGSLSVTFASPAVYENAGTLAATVTRTGSTAQAVTVQLASNNARATVPATVTIPAGQASANFDVTLANDATAQGADAQVVISASIPGTFAADSFAYTPNTALHGGGGGSGWTSNWADTYSPARFIIKSGGLTYTGWGGSDGYIEGSGAEGANNAWRDMSSTRNSGAFYFGVLMQLKPGAYRSSLFFGLGDGSHTDARNWMYPLRFQLNKDGVLSYHNGAYPTVWTDTTLRTASGNNESVNLVVGKVDFGANNAPGGGDDRLTVWLNPTLDGSGNEPSGGATFTVALAAVLRVCISGEWTNSRYDEIRVASTFGGLTGTAASGQGQFALRDDDTLAGIAAWRDVEFGDPAETGDATALADPDDDGIPNILEYALAGNPLAADGTGIVAAPAADYLTVAFTHPASMGDVVLEVEASPDLAAWTRIWTSGAPANALRTGYTNNGDGTATTTVRDAVPLADTPRRFLRLRALPAR